MLKAVLFNCCLNTCFFYFGKYEVGNVKRLLGVICVNGFLLCSSPDGPPAREKKRKFDRGEKHMLWHKAHTEFQNYMIAKRIIPPVATATGNLPFFILPESGLPCICVAVGRNRKPQSNPDSPPIEVNWQNSH